MEGLGGLWWGIIFIIIFGEVLCGILINDIVISLVVGIVFFGVLMMLIGFSGLGYCLVWLFMLLVMVLFMLMLGV